MEAFSEFLNNWFIIFESHVSNAAAYANYVYSCSFCFNQQKSQYAQLYLPFLCLSHQYEIISNVYILLSPECTQQTFAGLQYVLKTSLRHVLNTSSTRLQRNNFSSSRRFQDLSSTRLQHVFSVSIFRRRLAKTSSRHLEDMSWRRLKYISWKHLEDMSWRRLQDVLETNKMFIGDICI